MAFANGQYSPVDMHAFAALKGVTQEHLMCFCKKNLEKKTYARIRPGSDFCRNCRNMFK